MGIKLIKISVVYFSLSVLLGLVMSITHNYIYTGVHAHMNLLGWTSLTLAGIIYLLFPRAAETTLAKVHFWLHNIGLPFMMGGLFLVVSGISQVGIFISIGGTMVVIAVILFSINIWLNVKQVELYWR